MTNYLSQKIKNVSFLLMIMVVFLHSYNIDIKQSGKILHFEKDLNWIIQNFISNGVTRIAVPLFFIISGYLFVYKSDLTKKDFWNKIKKRIRTLLVPYLFWTLMGLLIYFVLQSFPQSQAFFTKELIKDYTFSKWINAIFYEPIPYQLWFLRDLIIMVFLSPMIFYLVKKLNFIYLIAVFVFWILNFDSVILTSEALLFFSLGMYFGFKKPQIFEIKIKKGSLLIFLWIALLALKTFAGFYDYKKVELYLLKISILVGIVAFWKCYDYLSINQRTVNLLKKISWASFFIYVFHEPAMTIIKKGIFYSLPKTPTTYFFVYLLAPLLVITLSILIAMVLKKNFNAVYQLITGARK